MYRVDFLPTSWLDMRDSSKQRDTARVNTSEEDIIEILHEFVLHSGLRIELVPPDDDHSDPTANFVGGNCIFCVMIYHLERIIFAVYLPHRNSNASISIQIWQLRLYVCFVQITLI